MSCSDAHFHTIFPLATKFSNCSKKSKQVPKQARGMKIDLRMHFCERKMGVFISKLTLCCVFCVCFTQSERKQLSKLRLDLDAAKGKARKPGPQQQQVLCLRCIVLCVKCAVTCSCTDVLHSFVCGFVFLVCLSWFNNFAKIFCSTCFFLKT